MTLNFDLLTPKVDRFMSFPWNTRVSWHQHWFNRLQNIVFTSSVTDERTDGRTDGQAENIMTPAAIRGWQRHTKLHIIHQVNKEIHLCRYK